MLFCGAEWRAPQCEVLNYDLQNNRTIRRSEQWTCRAVPYAVSLSTAKGKGGSAAFCSLKPSFRATTELLQMLNAFGPRLVLAILWFHCKPRAGVIGQFAQALGESPVDAQGSESVKLFLADNRNNLVRINNVLKLAWVNYIFYIFLYSWFVDWAEAKNAKIFWSSLYLWSYSCQSTLEMLAII